MQFKRKMEIIIYTKFYLPPPCPTLHEILPSLVVCLPNCSLCITNRCVINYHIEKENSIVIKCDENDF